MSDPVCDLVSAVRLLLVDDDPLVRSGLRLMLAGLDDVEVVGEVDDGDGLVEAVARCRPTVVLLDVRMPRTDGVSALRALRAAERDAGAAPVAVLVLTTFRAESLVLDALRAGASGYLVKHAPPGEIVAAVRAAAAGDPVVSASVLRQLIDHVAADEPDPSTSGPSTSGPGLDVLTDREREVAVAVADGLASADIATRLHLSVGSVKAHISSALAKLGLENRVQLAVLAHDARRSGRT